MFKFPHLTQEEIKKYPWDIRNYLELERAGMLEKTRPNAKEWDVVQEVEKNGRRIKRLPTLFVTGTKKDPRCRLETDKERQALLRYDKNHNAEWKAAGKDKRKEIEEALRR